MSSCKDMFLKLYFDVAYHLCVSPFKLVLRENVWETKSWRPHQIACGLIHLLSIFRMLVDTMDSITTKLDSDSVYAFKILGNVFFLCYISCTIYGLWYKRDIYHKIALATPHAALPEVYQCCWMKYPYLVKGVMGIIIITITVISGLECGSKLFASTQSWVDCSMDGGIKFWLLQRVNNSNSQHGVGVTLASLHTISGFSLHLSYAVFDIGQFSLIFSLWVAVGDFSFRHVHTTSKDLKAAINGTGQVLEVSGIQPVVSSLQDIHSYSELINKALCDRMAFYLLATSYFYPLNFSMIISPANLYESISFGIWFALMVTILVTAADVKSKMQNVTEELMIKNYRNWATSDYSQTLLLESLRTGIGIRGNESLEVTYSFLGNMYMLYITLFVLSTSK